jgi:hypothetical protein
VNTPILVTFRLPNGNIERNVVMGNGEEQMVSLPSAYLISAGQTFDFTISAMPAFWAAPPIPGEKLVNGIHLARIQVDMVHRYDFIPSNRPLYAIFEDIARHNDDYPTHGVNCACLDRSSYEIKRHVGRVLSDEQDPDHTRKLRWRIAHVLGMVTRWME